MRNCIYIIMDEIEENELIKKRGTERNRKYRAYFEKRREIKKRIEED